MNSQDIVTVKNFSKSFGSNKVVKDLSFEVKQGEIFAFLGANGSGKTTTIRCLLGVYEPTDGELLVDGRKYTHHDAAMLGYLPEERGLYLSSNVLETLIYFGRLKGIDYDTARKNALEYLERVGLTDKTTANVKQLSSGQQQKIQLGIAVINKPQLLILDEPTKGLDPVNRSLLMDVLLGLNKDGSTIIFSTHQMDEVEKIAERLVMIKNGERKLYGEINEVRKSFGTNTINVTVEGKIPENAKLYTFVQDGRHGEINPKKGVTSQEIMKFLISTNVPLTSFEISSPSLNEIFIQVSNENAK